MPLLGTLIKKAYQIKDRPALRETKVSPIETQHKELKKLLSKAQITAFGEHYDFSHLLSSKDLIFNFQSKIPVFDYSKMFQAW